MNTQPLHEWGLSPRDAIACQSELAHQLRDEPIALDKVRYVAGVDVSVKNNLSQAAVVVLSYPDLQVVERVRAQRPTDYPYIPGLLTFREGAVLIDAFTRLQTAVDVFVFDGMGRIHPRRMGIAAHLGLWLDKPTVGCGKTHYIGTYSEPANESGATSPIHHHGETIGAVLRTRPNVKPVYISAGHRATLDSSLTLVLNLVTRYRLPEPIRMAHQLAGQLP